VVKKEISAFIKTDNLTKIYTMGKVQVVALKDVTLTIEKGSFIGVTGSSGSGKSTLLNLLGGLDTPTSGTIEARGKVISRMNKGELALYRRHQVGMIFQSFNLINSFTALENVALPLFFVGAAKKERKQRAMELLSKVGLALRKDHRPAELSGGEQQRVAIARALTNQPDVLLADEPTGNLDTRTSEEIVCLLADLNQKHDLTVVMVSHEDRLLKKYSSHLVRLQDGQIVRREKEG
jgi:putative ABC transport system ATP-binding protein